MVFLFPMKVFLPSLGDVTYNIYDNMHGVKNNND